jgi:hypothetical protein
MQKKTRVRRTPLRSAAQTSGTKLLKFIDGALLIDLLKMKAFQFYH